MLATGIRKDQIPEEYKDLAIFGRGTTSIVLEKDGDTVLILTRDSMKAEWLYMNDLAEGLTNFETTGHHIVGLDDFDVHVLKMPKLNPLDKENRRTVRQAIKEFEHIRSQAISEETRRGGFDRSIDMDLVSRNIAGKYYDQESKLLHDPIIWAQNYDGNNFQYDFHMKNFMQDATGQIVVIDPFITSEIYQIIMGHKKAAQEIRTPRINSPAPNQFGFRP